MSTQGLALVCLGPGGEFTESYYAPESGKQLVRILPPIGGKKGRMAEQQDGAGQVVAELARRAGLLLAAERWLKNQGRVLRDTAVIIEDLTRMRPSRTSGSWLMPRESTQGVAAFAVVSREEKCYESDPQTTQNPSTHSRLASSPRLFPDDAGVGQRNRRQQGHRIRARRSPYQKGRSGARAEQGSLFVDR